MGKHFWLEACICLPLMVGCIYGIDHLDDIEYAYGAIGCFFFIVGTLFCCYWALVLWATGKTEEKPKRYNQNKQIPSCDVDMIDNMVEAKMYFDTFPEADFYIDKDGFYWDETFF